MEIVVALLTFLIGYEMAGDATAPASPEVQNFFNENVDVALVAIPILFLALFVGLVIDRNRY